MDELDAVAHSEVRPGAHVYDADGQLVGTVSRVRDTSFTITVAGPLDANMEVRFEEIESADDGRIELAVSGDELTFVPGATA